MNCIIIDDEATARIILNQLCSEMDGLNIVGEFENVMQAIQYLKKNQVDLILLDIHLPDFSGFELIESLEKFKLLETQKKIPKVILTTSDRNFAIEAYEYDCIIDYLVKPILLPRFKKAINKVVKSMSKKSETNFSDIFIGDSENQIYINIDRRLIKIDIPSIYLIEAKGDYIHLKTDNTNYIVHSSLKKVQSKLPSSLFLRVHRSYLINIKKIIDIEENTININKLIIPISRSSKAELMRRINLL